MSRPVANIEITTDVWLTVPNRLNTVLDALSNEIITANATFANTGTPASQRNAQLFGTFAANTFVVTTELRGGSNTSTSAALPISSNVIFSGATVNVASNVNFTANVNLSNTLFVTGRGVFSNTLAVTGNVNFSNTLTVTGQTTVSSISASSLTVNTDYVVDVSANSDLGATGSAKLFYSFPKATYRTAKVMVQAARTGNNQIAEMVIAHDNTNAYLSVYGVVASPVGANNSAPLGTFTVAINNANVEIYMTQTNANTAVKVVAHLIK